MTRPSIMAICILVALALPIFTCGLPAIDHSGSASKALPVRDSKPATSSDAEQKKVAIVASPYVRRESALVPEKSRQKRQSDHRLAELETLITLSLVSNMLSQMRYKKLDPMAIGRRRRAITRRLKRSFPRPLPIVAHQHRLAN
ncbi:uncharacterized protein LOC105181321 [Harpegnathos saltator]|uniref:uncharacterized protein LOC105181321 n=1 Tax=Harpegnathos saltator TaxID=610380 RepID=UPI00058F932D|nr:uncharacterized protein LOC105181321 [Harpegnathos saltator]